MSPRPPLHGSLLRVLAHSGHTGVGLSAGFKDRLVEFTIEALARLRASVATPGDGLSGSDTELRLQDSCYTLCVTKILLHESCNRSSGGSITQ